MPELDKLAAALTQDIVDAIGKTLAAAMETAVRNGADSRSMPDEYVTTAAWLSGATVETQQPEQPTPENFIIRIAGKVFHCSCGCNVFQKLDPDFPDEYTCNACGTAYE